jgi:hypothetical protein
MKRLEDRQARIQVLEAQIRNINETVYPDYYDEAKMLMLNALRDRIEWIEKSIQKRV